MMAARPPNPISTPWMSTKAQKLVVSPASTKPAPRLTAPTRAGHITPTRSDHAPITIPPQPRPKFVAK